MSLVGAKDQSFTINYNPSFGDVYEKTVDFSDVLVKISTSNDSICKYIDSGLLDNVLTYDDMIDSDLHPNGPSPSLYIKSYTQQRAANSLIIT